MSKEEQDVFKVSPIGNWYPGTGLNNKEWFNRMMNYEAKIANELMAACVRTGRERVSLEPERVCFDEPKHKPKPELNLLDQMD